MIGKIISLALLMMFSSSTIAIDLDYKVKKYCKYDVFGNGKDNYGIAMFLEGSVSGALYNTPTKEKKLKNNTKYSEVVSSACQRAFNDTSAGGFYNKFQWELSEVIRGN